MARDNPTPRPSTYADLVAEAEALWTDEAVAKSNRGIHPAFGHNTRKALISAHIGIRMTSAIREELDAKRRVEFGPLFKDQGRAG